MQDSQRSPLAASPRPVRGVNARDVSRRPVSSYRSCHTCHRRKIRCDKREPCSPCSRSDAMCVYPGPEERIKRPRKTTMAGVASRLSNLERLLPATPATPENLTRLNESRNLVVSPTGVPSSTHAHEDCSVDAVSMEHRQAFGNEILVRRGSRSQYFSEGFVARVIERVRYYQIHANSATATDKVC